jgi:CubicO group peptidase (beta-lactamase class C family)
MTENKITPINLNDRLAEFVDFVNNLQKKGLLDGEVLADRDGQIVLHLQSKDIVASDIARGPQFMIGSVSKQFFAVALLKSLYDFSLCGTEEAKIEDVKRKLHLPISKFLSEQSEIWGGKIPAWTHEISLHHLLTHTSGISNYTAVEAFGHSNLTPKGKRWYESYRSPNEIIELIRKEPLLFPSGSEFSYCNTGYVIIAEVIETIASMSVSQYLQEALFDQIGLSSTVNPDQGRWDILKLEQKIFELVAPFQYDPRRDQSDLYPLLYCEDISVARGGGSIISTSADLLKWNKSLHKDQSILPKELYRLMITANMNDYGYGIENKKTIAGTLLGHSGGIGSYRTLLLYLPEYDLSIVVLSSISSDFDKIEDELNEIDQGLKDSILDEKRRREAASKRLLEKYPSIRGFELITENVNKLFM